MKSRHVTLIAVLVAVVGPSVVPPGRSEPGREGRLRPGREPEPPHPGAGRQHRRAADVPRRPGKLWYRKSVKGGNEFVLVDAAAKTKAPGVRSRAARGGAQHRGEREVHRGHAAVHDVRLRRQPCRRSSSRSAAPAADAPAAAAAVADGRAAARRARRAAVALHAHRLHLHARGRGAGAGPGPVRDAGGGGRAAAAAVRAARARRTTQVRNSPDNKWEALIQNFNIYVRPAPQAGGPGAAARARARRDAVHAEHGRLRRQRLHVQLAPLVARLKKIAAFRRRPGYERLVHYVESSPADQLQPKHTTNFYRKPGDVVDFDHPVVFNVETKQQMPGDIALFPNPYANSRLEWRERQPRRDVRVQPARPSALSRGRDRRDDRHDPDAHRRDAEDVRRVLGQALSARTSPTARRSSGRPSATAGITCISTTAPPGR